MLASSQHVPLDFPTVSPVRDALRGRRGGGWNGEDCIARFRLRTSGQPLVAEQPCDASDRLVSATVPEEERFRHRFSIKPQDRETGLLYCGHHDLETATGFMPYVSSVVCDGRFEGDVVNRAPMVTALNPMGVAFSIGGELEHEFLGSGAGDVPGTKRIEADLSVTRGIDLPVFGVALNPRIEVVVRVDKDITVGEGGPMPGALELPANRKI